MKRLLLLMTLLLLVVACAPTTDPEANDADGTIVVENVQANLALPSDTGSVWLQITNNSGADDALVGAQIDGCGIIELHDMFIENDVMVMRPVEGGQIPLPAGETVELQRGGLHIMCLEKESFTEGETVAVTLQFATAAPITVNGPVVSPMGGDDMPMGGDE